MDIIKYQETCTLCGLIVKVDDFSIITKEGLQKFCCAGCLSVYQLLNDDTTKTSLITQPLNQEDNKK